MTDSTALSFFTAQKSEEEAVVKGSFIRWYSLLPPKPTS